MSSTLLHVTTSTLALRPGDVVAIGPLPLLHRYTRWFRPRTVIYTVDHGASLITLAAERWSWWRWRWVRA